MTDADKGDDELLLANTPAQAESLQHSREQVARGIVFYVNADKTEIMCFKQGAITTTSDKPRKLVDLI